MNLVPYPNLHFLLSSYAPIINRGSQYQIFTDKELLEQAFSARNMMCDVDPRHGRYLTGYMMFRGRWGHGLNHEAIFNVQNKNSQYFVEWIPNNTKSSVYDVPTYGRKNSVAFIGNSTAI